MVNADDTLVGSQEDYDKSQQTINESEERFNSIKIIIIMTQQKKDGLNIELTEEVAQGAYSNLAIINHSPSEFVVDFIQMMPELLLKGLKSRVILTPQHAKRLMKALVENIKKFENQHGNIKDIEPNGTVPMNFGGPTPLA